MRTKRRVLLIRAAAVATIAVLVYAWRNRPVRTQRTHPDLESSLKVLNPIFAAKIRTLMARMERRGFDPMIWETGRTQERAVELAERGTGIVGSMHIYGLAVDIVSADELWGASAPFWAALQGEAINLGLTSGAAFGDRDHIQALPTKFDADVRRSTPAQIARLVRNTLT